MEAGCDFNDAVGPDSPRELEDSIGQSKKRLEKEAEAEKLPLNLTLGIEFEFLLLVSRFPEEATNDNRHTDDGIDLVHSVLSQPLRATCVTCVEEHTFQLPLAHVGSTNYRKWIVDEESSIELTRDERNALGSARKFHHPYQIELKSRILKRALNLRTSSNPESSGHMHQIDCNQEIHAVLNQFEESFNAPEGVSRTHARMVVNQKCGLHVHLGNGHRGFPLRTVKYVVFTYIANERAVDSLHSLDRVDGSAYALHPASKSQTPMEITPLNPQAYNRPWSEVMSTLTNRFRRSQAGLYNPSRGNEALAGVLIYPENLLNKPEVREAAPGYNIADWLTMVRHAPSVLMIRKFHDPYGGACTLNLNNLEDFDCRGNTHAKMTFEFRQHAGTLDVSEVLHWTNVLASIVLHAHSTDDAGFDHLCADVWQSPHCHTLDFLQTIACSRNTVDFYRHKLGMRTAGSHYAMDLMQRGLNSLYRFPSDDSLRGMMILAIQKRLERILPTFVNRRINQKFTVGGYGQFSSDFLVEVDFSEAGHALREKLTIGWVNEEGTGRPPPYSGPS